MSDTKDIIFQAIEGKKAELIELSDTIWKNPELAYEEFKSHDLLVDFFTSQGFKVESKYKIPTAFRAEFGKEGGLNIAFMCEYDALPELGHACGHNLIAQVGVGASLGLKAAIESGNLPVSKVTVFGCPAEEDGGGKIDLINAGAFKDVDIALMCHPTILNSAGLLELALTEVKVTYKGKATHAAGYPWEGVNALDAAVMGYSNISCLRQQFRPKWSVHGIVTNGGTQPNIIPEETQLFYYIRAPTVGQLKLLTGRMKQCFEAAAMATGCDIEYEWNPKPYDNMLQIQNLQDIYIKHAQDLGIDLCLDPLKLEHSTGSTDMGNVSHVVPSIHAYFEIGAEDVEHSRVFQEQAGTQQAFDAAIQQSKVLSLMAVDVINSPELFEAIKQDFAIAYEADAAP